MTRTTWVIGSHGLLGRHVTARLDRPLESQDVPWLDQAEARLVLRQGIRALMARAAGGPWDVLWCAGAGVVGTPAELVERERRLFESFLTDLTELIEPALSTPSGAVFFASSAGGVYAGSTGPPFSELTAPRPLTPYGRAKLSMEAALEEFSRATGTRALVGRIANLYGPGQNLDKPQGLVSQVCLTHLTGQPLSLYVSPDTRRDYLYVEDCARLIVAGLDRLRVGDERHVVKVLASGRSITAGGLIGESTRLFRRRPRIVFGASPVAALQVRDLRLRSVRWSDLDRLARTPLPIGIARTADDVARRLAAGSVRVR